MSQEAWMTVGELSRRTGVPIKALRVYADSGLILGTQRSPAGYRLFDEGAVWCVQVVESLRAAGLRLGEIRGLAKAYLAPGDEPIGPRISAVLEAVLTRTGAGLDALQQRLARLEAVRLELTLDSPPGVRP